jgi:two-component system OmpR family response regulator
MSLKPDIIILDYYLNSVTEDAMNGLETLKKIRAIDTEVPVVMLSVETNKELIKNCLAHDANEFIIKSDICSARLREIITGVFMDKQHKINLISELDKAIKYAALASIILTLCWFYLI